MALATVADGDEVVVRQGSLHCTGAGCQQEYPIIDGIPVLVANVREWIADNVAQLVQRDDLHPLINSMLGDCAGPGSVFDTMRQHVSIYAWDAYADLDPGEPIVEGGARPGALVRCLEAGRALTGDAPEAPVLDAGCAVGRSSFDLAAHTDGLVLGIDLHVPMLRLAQAALRDGRVRYPRRRVGLVYDERDFAVTFDGAERVDFWACDALNLPFKGATFGHAVGLNLIDCVPSPIELLHETRRCLRDGATALWSTPYDWSPAATPVQAWLGGHSQRGPDLGASEPMLRRLLTAGAHPQSVAGFELIGENAAVPWHTRLHERSIMSYAMHMVAARSVSR
ncbi:MAG: methyltransferase domain-containing protein [Pseudomonadota bacterium]